MYQQERNGKYLKFNIMTTATLKNKVIAKLIKWGNNETEVNNMVETHFEYAFEKYSTVNKIAECIRTIY